ncbi:hypothetical protein LNQ49_19850 [Flavobacterium sp. F-65]|uniref:Uncharacterized protein n=1 Tax=Flavobacterium pisciphilum TaxID=2893755 RepID=A0ABS8N0B2_9FLAO|nr:hypothetical protein [Flavobacterium sp. F-65]MCC9073841.1 hypothetical protein [Flavobacterium sp. F-65]
MNWAELKKNIYYVDGSLRDIYIKNTDIVDNEKWCEFVNNNYVINWFNGIREINEDKIDFESVKGYLNNNHNLCSSASVYIEKIRINNHFFIDEEIENDISPNEINTIQDHEKIIKYMTELSILLNKPVILTPEGTEKEILIRVTKNGIEYFPEN